MRREQAGKELESNPCGTSLGEVLSCRFSELGRVAKARNSGGADVLGRKCRKTRTNGSKGSPRSIRREPEQSREDPKLGPVKTDVTSVMA